MGGEDGLKFNALSKSESRLPPPSSKFLILLMSFSLDDIFLAINMIYQVNNVKR